MRARAVPVFRTFVVKAIRTQRSAWKLLKIVLLLTTLSYPRLSYTKLDRLKCTSLETEALHWEEDVNAEIDRTPPCCSFDTSQYEKNDVHFCATERGGGLARS